MNATVVVAGGRPYGHQLFERCARLLNSAAITFSDCGIADACEHRLFLIGADIAQR